MSTAANTLVDRASALELVAANLYEQADAIYEEAAALKRLARTMTKADRDIAFTDKASGRLTDAGIKEMEQMFTRNERVSDIARHLDVTQSAISYRYKVWNDRRAKKGRG